MGRDRADIFQNAIIFIKANLYEKISCQDIADYCYVSISGLQKDFQRFAGCGAKAFYLRMKLEEGKRLLIQGKSVSAIAKKMHFSSTPHFSMAFKKQFGISPSQYKKLSGGSVKKQK